ncbi:ATP-dependent Clp protease proteolytic subunit 6, chloroplastic -like protein [Gossypium arboreum]|uniref:ATP-dependent Clp protease proteolytic subunit n=1 Tax=Gossypium arboreum TaxID=29729 RepID=A0A0B0MXF1_GOSAR|nr:ATP-dependent Clp protease proteolytic subunit 6, chloroplastic -like protein [Gossypium arboreum]
MVASAVSSSSSLSLYSRTRPTSISSPSSRYITRPTSISSPSSRSSTRLVISALPTPYGDSSTMGLSSKVSGLPLKIDKKGFGDSDLSYSAIEARKGNPPVMPAVMTPGGPLDLSTVLFRNRIIFIGQPVNSQVAQRVITQLVTLAAIDENADILIKPKVGTVCFGVAASQGALLLAGGEKGMRYAMPNARIMIHQPQSGCGGHVEDVRRQVNEAVQSRHKIDKMYAAFTGQPLEKVQQYTERDRFLSVSEAMEFGLIDGVLETEY